MICLACKKQIPDDSTQCPNCGSSIDHQIQVVHEIKMRRYQRWFFYTFFTIIFLGMIGVIGWIYRENTKLVADISGTKNILDEAQRNLDAKESELSSVKYDLSQKDQQYQQISAKTGELEKDKTIQEDELKLAREEKEKIDNSLKQCYMDNYLATANVYGLISKLGKKLSVVDLNKIPVAVTDLVGTDSDKDGLPDAMEAALGTKSDSADTDGDTYSDKDELSRNFNPRGSGRMPIDSAFSNKHKGALVVQSNSPYSAWFVGNDARRYFLGESTDAYKYMRSVDYWASDWKKISSASPISPGREQANRDSQRIADIKQIQTILELYFNDNNSYPQSLTAEGLTAKYIPKIPEAPLPVEGSCTLEENTYNYYDGASGRTYMLTYCLEGAQGGISAGFHTATPSTIAQ